MLPLLLALLAPVQAQESQAPSVDVGQEADLHFTEGIAAYRAGRYTEALEHLLLSNRLVPNRNTGFNIARAYEQLGQYAEAFRYYDAFVRLETDPERRSPGERAIERIQSRVALVHVESDPPGANVYVDRVDLGARGTTPLTLALDPGTQRILVGKELYETGEATATLVLGQRAEVTLDLDRDLAGVTMSGGPEGAIVRLGDADGPQLGTMPGHLFVPAGTPTVTVTAPGYKPLTRVLQAPGDSEQNWNVDLERITGRLVVNATQRDALVSVDGEALGFSPAVLTVPVGTHTVEVTLAGYQPAAEEITVVADSSLTLDVALRSIREVVAASRTAQGVDEAPASVSLVGAREIRAFGYQNLYQALANVRGVYQTNDLTYQYLGFRGFSTPGDYGNRVLVTVDGHTMNDDQLGASYVGTDFTSDLEDVQQVEVVRGPGSALYGSNAFFGVINVVTHDHRSMPRPHTKVSVDSDSTLRARAGSGFGGEKTGGWLSAAGLVSQGRDYTFDALAGLPRANPTGASIGADGTSARTLHGRAWIGDLEVQGFHHGREKAIPTGAFGTRLADPRAAARDYRSFGEVRWMPSLQGLDAAVRAWVDSYRYEGAFPYGAQNVSVDAWDGVWAGAEPRIVAHPAEWLSLTAGAESRQHFSASLTTFTYSDLDAGELADPDPVNSESPTFAVYSGYAIAELILGDVARISAGGRVDSFDTAQAIDDDVTTFNPRMALVLHPSDRDVLKLMGGTAFRAPSVYEYLYDDDGVTQIEPDALDPETVLTAEAEYTHRFDDVTALTIDAYHNRMDRLIDTELLGGGVFRYANTDALTQTVGTEIELQREWRQGWMASAHHSAQHTREGSLAEGREVVNSPPHILVFKGAIPVASGDTTLAAVLRNESPRRTLAGGRTPWAHVVDLTLTGDVPRLGVDWGLGVRNALDWRQDHPSGPDLRMSTVPQPGRSAFASVRTAW